MYMKSFQAVHAALTCLLLVATTHVAASNSKQTHTFTIGRTAGQTTETVCNVSPSVLRGELHLEEDVATALTSGTLKIFAVQGSNDTYYGTSTKPPYGHYFSEKGVAVAATNKKAMMYAQFDGASTFTIGITRTDVALDGHFNMKQALVNLTTKDTVEFCFNITIGTQQLVESDIPAYTHRADITDSWIPLPYVRQNDQQPLYDRCLQVNVGDRATFGFRPRNEGDVVKFNVKNPAGKTIRTTKADDFTLTAVEPSDAGTYTLIGSYTYAAGGSKTFKYEFLLDVQEHQGEFFDWAKESPRWSYNFRDEYPNGFPQPVKVHKFTQHNGKPANRLDGDWWTVYWGDNLNSECGSGDVLEHAMKNMMQKYDTDFAYIRDEMGWPPDINARKGYKSFVYVFGSGINRDNTSPTEAGGYQGMAGADDGGTWPCVWASYYPVSRFRDDADKKWNDGEYQREAMIHEGIHAVFADMDGVKKSSWFHEAGNVWLQMAMNAKRSGTYGAPGWLGVGNLICPFMPIECYSGWLQDGSFGGPAAEGVNMYGPTGQVCTWRNLLGGTQYGEMFPLFLGEAIGQGSVPWIWRYCSDYVLKGIALGNKAAGVDGIGDEAMRLFIMQYRAKLATLDFGGFTKGCLDLVNNNFGVSVRSEWRNGVYDPATNQVTGRNANNDQMPCWIDVAPFKLTPYQKMEQNDADGWLAPEELTLPGWSGGNIIPIHVSGNGCEVFFRPEDTQMRAQLCYRTKNGKAFYSQPVYCGMMKMSWSQTERPANDVVFAVVCNTDYIYTGDEQRKHKWDYRLKLGDGAIGLAATDIRWFNYSQTLVDKAFETGIEAIDDTDEATDQSSETFHILSTVHHSGSTVQFDLGSVMPDKVVAHLVGLSGVLIDEQPLSADATITLPGHLPHGLYVLSLKYGESIQSFKIIIE